MLKSEDFPLGSSATSQEDGDRDSNSLGGIQCRHLP